MNPAPHGRGQGKTFIRVEGHRHAAAAQRPRLIRMEAVVARQIGALDPHSNATAAACRWGGVRVWENIRGWSFAHSTQKPQLDAPKWAASGGTRSARERQTAGSRFKKRAATAALFCASETVICPMPACRACGWRVLASWGGWTTCLHHRSPVCGMPIPWPWRRTCVFS
ncbi:MAG: hypothetical protein RIS44_1919 [Pseudomonadota bacterium]